MRTKRKIGTLSRINRTEKEYIPYGERDLIAHGLKTKSKDIVYLDLAKMLLEGDKIRHDIESCRKRRIELCDADPESYIRCWHWITLSSSIETVIASLKKYGKVKTVFVEGFMNDETDPLKCYFFEGALLTPWEDADSLSDYYLSGRICTQENGIDTEIEDVLLNACHFKEAYPEAEYSAKLKMKHRQKNYEKMKEIQFLKALFETGDLV